MAFADAYRNQVALLIRALPSVAAEECFAMKGGTAINLFIRDLPRLSVDIDLTYLPVQDRAASLAAIDAAMLRVAERITEAVRGTRVTPSRSRENVVTKLVVRSDSSQIKIEVTPVLRGCVFEPDFVRSPRASKTSLVSRKCGLSPFRISMPGRSSPRSTDSTHVTSSMRATSWRTKASTTRCGGPFLSTSSATTAQWPRC
jgi:hypothetical protein